MLVRFEYVTDDAVYLDGLLIDGITIPELDFSDVRTILRLRTGKPKDSAGPAEMLAQGFIVQVVTSTPER